jgi:hypothetical protein
MNYGTIKVIANIIEKAKESDKRFIGYR